MQRLKNLDDWQLVAVGKKLVLPSSGERKVRLEVSVSDKTVLTIKPSSGKKPPFTTVVHGFEVLEFTVCDGYHVTGDKPFHCYTVEGEQIHVVNDGSETFTELKTRRARNRELEEVVARAHRNSELRIQRLLAEQEKRFEQLQKEQKEQSSDETKRAGDSGTGSEESGQNADPSPSPVDKGPESDVISTENESGAAGA